MTTQNYLNQPGNLSEREMLVFAAKAGGIADGNVFYDMDRGTEWNSLADDGNALRLAGKLRISITFERFDDCDYVMATPPNSHQGYDCIVDQDVNKAIRHAITRAAAAIGEQMP